MSPRRLRPLILLALLLLIAPKPVNALLSGFCPPSTALLATIGSNIGLGLGLALLAMTVSIDVVAIGYMISKIIPSSGLGSWIRNEYWEIAKTAMIIAGIYAILTFMGNVAVILNGGAAQANYVASTTNLANGAEQYLCTVFGAEGNQGASITDAMNFLTGMNIGIGILNSLTIGAWLPLPALPILPFQFTFGFTMTPYGANNMLITAVPGIVSTFESISTDFVNFIVFPVALIIISQIYALVPLVSIGLLVIIPMGIVLRSFPFIRGLGGTLIAIGVGLAIIYPSILLLLNEPVSAAMAQNVPGPQLLVGSSCLGTNGSGGIFCPLVNLMISALNGYYVTTQATDVAYASFNSILPAINAMLLYNFYLVVQFMLFIIDLTIFYLITDSLARALGGSMRLSVGKALRLG